MTDEYQSANTLHWGEWFARDGVTTASMDNNALATESTEMVPLPSEFAPMANRKEPQVTSSRLQSV
jgi:hypothetical protein